MAELKRPGATLYFSDTGPRNAPVVVFGHGLLFSSWMFHYQIDELRERYRCIGVDWRGHGLTTAKGSFDIEDITDDLEALLEHIGQPVHYVGHSMGAYIGIPLAARRPDMFLSVTLVGASATAEDPDTAARYHRLANVYNYTGKALLIQRVKEIMFSDDSLKSSRVKRQVDDWVEEVGYPSRRETRDAIRAVANRHGVQCEASALSVPTQIIVGEEDAANPPNRSRRLQELVRHAPLHTIAGVGHVPTIEAPQDINRLLTTFFWQAERRAQS